MADLTYFTARQFFVRERETAILRQAYVNASLARSSLRSTEASTSPSCWPRSTPCRARARCSSVKGQWYATSISVGRERHPGGRCATWCVSGTPATQHFDLGHHARDGGRDSRCPSVAAAYFEVFSLDELARTLRILALALTGAALVTTVAGAVIGRWASGRALRPLAEVSRAAQEIAGGGLDTRLTAGRRPRPHAPGLARSTRWPTPSRSASTARCGSPSDVSHELRSPLTTATTALERARVPRATTCRRAAARPWPCSPPSSGASSAWSTTCSRSAASTPGAAELSLDEVEVGELMRQAAAPPGRSDVPVDVDPSVAGLRLWVDKRRIERVVANLVANAEQYAGGVTRPGRGARRLGGVRLVVADQGPGVPPGERERIFERFYRGQSAGSRGATDGSGLGLSLVAEHVRLHGGRVWVETGARRREPVRGRAPGRDGPHQAPGLRPPGRRDGRGDLPTRRCTADGGERRARRRRRAGGSRRSPARRTAGIGGERGGRPPWRRWCSGRLLGACGIPVDAAPTPWPATASPSASCSPRRRRPRPPRRRRRSRCPCRSS